MGSFGNFGRQGSWIKDKDQRSVYEKLVQCSTVPPAGQVHGGTDASDVWSTPLYVSLTFLPAAKPTGLGEQVGR